MIIQCAVKQTHDKDRVINKELCATMTVNKIVLFTRVLFVVRALQFCEIVKDAEPILTGKHSNFWS